MRDLAPGEILDGYELTALLARGGMASVYKAIDRETGRTIALKVPHIQYESDVVFYARFCREEEAARRIDHPNVVKALAPRGERSRLYMVLEYVDGVPLSDLLAGGRALPRAQALDLARQVCDALVYLHGLGIHHRDVKPGNILVTAQGQVKLLDFGIAHVTAARRLTISGLSASLGTPDYMAPEQVRGRVGDGRVDLYALGTLLYRMLTGHLPHAGEDEDALLRARELEDPTPPSAHLPDLEPGIEAIVLKAIEHAPGDRYATAADMLADLRDPGAVAPRPARSGRPRRRRDLRPLGATAAIVAALGLLGWVAWLAHLRGLEPVADAAIATDAGRVGAVAARRGPPPAQEERGDGNPSRAR